MKKLIAATGCFVIFCLLINGILLPSLPQVKAENEPDISYAPVSDSKPESVDEPSSRPETYILKNYKGKIAVFSSNSEIPIKITDTEVSKLPEEDRVSLEKGIEVTDKLKLNRLLEDYCS